MLRQVILHHPRPTALAQQLPLTRREIYLFYRDAGAYGVDAAWIALARYWATWNGHPPDRGWERHIEVVQGLWVAYWHHREEWIAPPPLLSGSDLIALGLRPGPEIGELLARLREEQAAGEINTRQQALQRLRDWSSID